MADSQIISTFQTDSLPLSKVKILPNGNMHFLAPIARVTSSEEKGLPYNDAKGQRYYQTVNIDVLTSSIDSFKGLSICLGHPPEKVRTSLNKRLLTRGLTSTGRTFNTDSHVWMCGTNFDDELIKAITDRTATQISLAYDINLKPTAQKDVFEQISRNGDHLAFVPKGRNGSTVGINLDSEDTDSIYQYFSEFNTDSSDYLQLIRSELDQLPSEISNLEEVYLPQSVNLDRILVTKNKNNSEQTSNMKTFSIVDNKGSVISYQADTEDVLHYIQHLRTQLEETTVQLSNQDSETQAQLTQQITDLASQVAELTTENDRLKTSASNQDSVDEINKKASAIALGMFQILPSILQLDANYDIGSTPKSQTELMRDYLILVTPARKAELESMNFDESPTGIHNKALIGVMYQVAKDLSSKEKQPKQQNQDSASSEMAALQRLLRGSLVQDSATAQQQSESRYQGQVASIDSNF